jgi:ribosomal protein L12E/L44/L45/RPP1/RPP2
LILILVCVVAFGGGLYLLNEAIGTRFDSVDQAVTGGTDTVLKTLERVDNKVVSVQDTLKAMEAKMAAPVAAPAPAAPAEGAAAAPAEKKPEAPAEKK